MSDVNAPLSLPETEKTGSGKDGSASLLILLALALATGGVALAVLSRDTAEPFVLAILAGLSIIGVFSLFAGAAGILRFGERRAREDDVAVSLADNLPDGALVTTPRGEVVYANEAYKRLFGPWEGGRVCALDEVFSGISNASEQLFRLSRAARQGDACIEEIEGAKSDASLRSYRVSVRQIPAHPDRRMATALALWLVTDITGERAGEDKAFESLQQMIDYLDGAPAGFVSADRTGKVAYMNATLARWLGRDLSEVADGKLTLNDLVFGDAQVLLKPPPETAEPPRKQAIETDFVCRDGTTFTARVLYRPATSQEGRAALSHMIVLDAEQDAAAAEDARETKARFARMFHTTPIAIASIDERGRIGDANAAFSKMFARSGARYEAGKTPLAELVSGEGRDALDKAIRAARAGQVDIDPVDLVFGEHTDRSGRFYFSATPAVEGDEATVIVHAIDITEQRELELKYSQSQKMDAVGQLAGGIAHDFNNVLTAIIGFSELLLANHRPTDPAFQDIMNIKQNANRAAGLVRQLLAFSRQQRLSPEVMSLNDVLADLTILLGRLLGEKTKLDLQHGRDLWLVKADLHQFEQVIVNLAVNARDAMPDGGKLTIRTANVTERESRQLNYNGMEPGEYVLCEVTDTGTGMPADVMAKIFEPFFTTKEVNKGTGLGLSTVYGIVKQSGGYVYPESEGVGKGTTFRIYLPRHLGAADDDVIEDGNEAALDDEKPITLATSKDLTGSGTILLVEDEEAVRSFAARALEGRGYTVLQAGTGAEALEVLEAHDGDVDLVVSDVVMPEMDGPTLLTKLRETRPDLKVIFISGYAEEAFRKNLEGEETFAFLPKPFSLKQLAAAVKDLLGE